MKTKHLLGALLSFLCTIIFFSCGNNNEEKIYPLSFEKEYYSQASLQEMIEDEITSYQKNGAITLNKVEVQEAENGNTVTVEITYASGA